MSHLAELPHMMFPPPPNQGDMIADFERFQLEAQRREQHAEFERAYQQHLPPPHHMLHQPQHHMPPPEMWAAEFHGGPMGRIHHALPPHHAGPDFEQIYHETKAGMVDLVKLCITLATCVLSFCLFSIY
jgi:hypothetical protein